MMALPGNDFIKVDCTVMDDLNEDLILTADVVSRLEKGRQKISVNEATSPPLSEITSICDNVSDANTNDGNIHDVLHDGVIRDVVNDVNSDVITSGVDLEGKGGGGDRPLQKITWRDRGAIIPPIFRKCNYKLTH